ncbi:MAG: bifunctional UDP-N-acetylmuramoyl-tripeptide:D-alanyl-D-alanine ligase/alanine racemase [Alistipes sp.]|nr:bifunctional UDP-N-acetylmuramoyl-tripeptide:D-alanyl-D-alanine ligase/alanine racemase [Candidatus Minthomonas equi]
MSLNVSIDSRTVISPSETAFFALTGKYHNGHDYIPELYSRGVRNFTVSEWRDEFEKMDDAIFHRTEDTLKALQEEAGRHREELAPDCEVVAITGSNGKTVVKEWIAQMLSDDPNVYRSPRSWNSQIVVSLSLLEIKENCHKAIIEAGISLPGEMDALERIIRPTVGIFTHLGDAHSDNFVSIEEKLREKCILFRNCGTVICREGKTAELIRSFVPDAAAVKTWSIREGSSRDSFILNTPFVPEFELTLPFNDEASIENTLTAVTYLLYGGVSPESLRDKVRRLQPVAMRLEIKEGINRCTLIKDYYNSDPDSFAIALQRLTAFSSEVGKAVILSDFVDSVEDETTYASIAEKIKKAGISLFIGIGSKLSEYSSLFSKIPEHRFYKDTNSFLRSEERNSFRGMALLLKGARTFHFESIATFLQKHSHTTILEVDLDAMAYNLNCFRALLPKETMTAVMVKAFTYGTGSAEVASMLQFQGVNYLMVAYSDEGVELRSKGITVPIGVMNPEPESFDDIIEFNLEPEIYSMDMLTGFEEALVRHGEKNYPVHIKLNTGMNRSGLDRNDIDALTTFYDIPRCSIIRSVFSHLATADEPQQDEFTRRQLNLFTELTQQIQSHFSHHIIRHVLNSAGIERFTDYAFDMVRLGIGLHGIGFGLPLKPVSSFKTHIIAIRDVYPGDTVGYGRHGVITGPSSIAVIPVGYADGLNRHLGCGIGEMYAKGHRVHTIGNICMDACMLDVTGTGLKVGDEVEIFGTHIPVTEVSDKLGTIPYEVLTSVSQRVQRIYYNE